MRMSQKNLELVLLLCIIVIAFMAYRFGYMGYTEKAKVVELQNKTIETNIATLQERENHRAEFNAGISSAESEINSVLERYGAGNTPEKSIMLATKLQKAADVKISTLTFTPDTEFFASVDTKEDGSPKIVAYKSQLTLSYATDYAGFKKMVDFVNNYPERMTVNSFTMSFDQETGGISGSMIIDLYSVSDENHVYVAPSVNGIAIGKDNIFE